ncbi:aminotransferase class I/II-fold pyridoxal phosphate-dependent enzyme [Aquibacillus kalidii]|uniref:aminotransferase class I/II-fold pyridoxal phosphate-dependent enzyme n=1 Tax=Aquibacillus kalidii TaxID=2762597 RepID=UPI0016489931|nr:aminotransferase class I/II-fold pyridoxal phosphate-dependent enzyme [Aquibacillus kalidii]
MEINNSKTPLFDKLQAFKEKGPLSLHVPGHKSGTVFAKRALNLYQSILSIDLTELSGLDDLHAPTEVISEAQTLAAKWFGAQHTYFLVGGSTVGNLAMILATCNQGDKVIVQRNCHKSILNGLELCGAHPIFVTPQFEADVDRYGGPTVQSIQDAIQLEPNVKALILTYPDYFGRTYQLDEIIKKAHQYNIPVLIDEAHGVHFSLDSSIFPNSAVELGADIVVQSAHKMAPAMTMGAYLHLGTSLVSKEKVAHYLQILQSSSPSYPIMASLDLARYYLEQISITELSKVQESVGTFRKHLAGSSNWDVLPYQVGIDDPLKITIKIKNGLSGQEIARLFEKENIYPELSTHNQILFIHGLKALDNHRQLQQSIESIKEQLKTEPKHATIEDISTYLFKSIQTLEFSYQEMKNKKTEFTSWENIENRIASEAVIPYPPGIPIIARGEIVTTQHIKMIKYLYKQGIRFQNDNIKNGLKVFLTE